MTDQTHNTGDGASTGSSPLVADRIEAMNRDLQAAARGDQLAFRRLYTATSGRLLAQAMVLLRNRDAAEDVVQDAFVRIWTRAGHYDPSRGHALPWMGRILRNLAIDRLRRDRLMARYHTSDEAAEHAPAPAAPLDDRLDLVRALTDLAPAQREAIVQVVVRGWTHDEAGRTIGVPTPTSKARALRGLKRMRALYEQGAGQGSGALHGRPIQRAV